VPVSLPSSALAAASCAVIHPRIALIRINTVGRRGEHPAGPLITIPTSTAGDALLATSGAPLAPTQPPVLYDGGSMAQRSYRALKFHTFASHHPDVWTTVEAITFSGCEKWASSTARGRRLLVDQPTMSACGAPNQLSPDARGIGDGVVSVLMTSNATSAPSVGYRGPPNTTTRLTVDLGWRALALLRCPTSTRIWATAATFPVRELSRQCAAVSMAFGATSVPAH
jgi:hypothetical protein